MLQFIREKSQGIIALVIVVFIALTFALWGVHNYFSGSPAAKPVAKVNGTKISQQEFSSAFQRYRQAQMHKNPQLLSSQDAIQAMKKELLDSMITTNLLSQAASQYNFRVGKNLVELALARMPVFQVDGQFSTKRFQRLLSNMMYSQHEFFSQLQTSILLAQLKSGFTKTAFALPYQINNEIKLINQKRSFSYVEIPAKHFYSAIEVTPQQIKQYYQTHQNQFKVPQKVSVSYLSLSLDKLSKQIKPTTKDLKQYYSNNINHFTKPKKWYLSHILISVSPDADKKAVEKAKQKAQHILQQVKSGQSFSTLAKQNSDDLKTAKKDGVMQPKTLLQLNSNWQKHIYNLKNKGDVTEPFKTKQGFEIVKLLKRKKAVVQPFDQVKKKVRQQYIQQKAEKQFADKTDILANLTFEHPDTLKPAAKKLGLSLQTTALFSHKGGDTKLTKNPKVIKAAFSDDVLTNANNSDVLHLSDTKVLVLRINKQVPQQVKPLKKVKSTVEQKLKQEQASKQARQLAKKIQKAVKSGKTLKTVARQNHLSKHQSPHPMQRNQTDKVNSVVVNKAFHLQRPTKTTPSVGTVELKQGGYAVVQLEQVEDGQLGENKDHLKASYKNGIAHALGQLEYHLFVHGLRQSADIKYYDNQ